MLTLARSGLVLLGLGCIASAVTYAAHKDLQSCLEAVAIAGWAGWHFWRSR